MKTALFFGVLVSIFSSCRRGSSDSDHPQVSIPPFDLPAHPVSPFADEFTDSYIFMSHPDLNAMQGIYEVIGMKSDDKNGSREIEGKTPIRWIALNPNFLSVVLKEGASFKVELFDFRVKGIFFGDELVLSPYGIHGKGSDLSKKEIQLKSGLLTHSFAIEGLTGKNFLLLRKADSKKFAQSVPDFRLNGSNLIERYSEELFVTKYHRKAVDLEEVRQLATLQSDRLIEQIEKDKEIVVVPHSELKARSTVLSSEDLEKARSWYFAEDFEADYPGLSFVGRHDDVDYLTAATIRPLRDRHIILLSRGCASKIEFCLLKGYANFLMARQKSARVFGSEEKQSDLKFTHKKKVKELLTEAEQAEVKFAQYDEQDESQKLSFSLSRDAMVSKYASYFQNAAEGLLVDLDAIDSMSMLQNSSQNFGEDLKKMVNAEAERVRSEQLQSVEKSLTKLFDNYNRVKKEAEKTGVFLLSKEALKKAGDALEAVRQLATK